MNKCKKCNCIKIHVDDNKYNDEDNFGWAICTNCGYHVTIKCNWNDKKKIIKAWNKEN